MSPAGGKPPRSARSPGQPVITVTRLRKAYGSTVAVDDISFDVYEGEIFGLIGPNGAGKTTTMECVEGVRDVDGGAMSILGLDPRRQRDALQNRIGIQLQQAQLQKRIRVWEAVDLWSSLYRRSIDGRALLERLGLHEKRNATFMSLSGGQKQRLFIALALINDPEVVFLDELTTGLDPQARRAIWDFVLGMRERGKTVFLTTHLMEEAERLCDRVAIIEHGRLIAMGTPADLVREHCPQRGVMFTSDREDLADLFAEVPGAVATRADGTSYLLEGRGEDFVDRVIHGLAQHQVHVRDFRTVVPTLEDVFLKLTGHGIRD